ncbi:anti sigma factor C-terminal domain-containing protein [Clostridium yunnanense]|uniref:anti sigma factor C-terminal domain-containing protein n=1 Tax=Clostridium yunnanense TaxID=2800325 RepID=UPI001FAC9B47|nr:anti sigma factor C-terminal domain-containing protein [Clostridium yunnanense]
MKSDDEKLNELFNTKETTDFGKTIKKAKVFSILRTVILSLMIVIILSFTLLVTNASMLNKIANQKERNLRNWYTIGLPNAFMGNVQFDDKIMTGEIDYVRYRFLGNKPVVDGNYKKDYKYVPLINGVYGDISNHLYASNYKTQQDLDETINYNKDGKRVMRFYHPSVKYDKYPNDLVAIDKVGSNKLVELAISFDKAYTLDKVKEMFPNEVTLNWYWVDTYNEKDLTKDVPIEKGKSVEINSVFEENNVYGIKALDGQGNKIDNPEGDFINTITIVSKDKNSSSIYKELFNKLSEGKGEIKKENLKIIGVVVSGDTDSLKKLKNQNYIKAATLGATADKY